MKQETAVKIESAKAKIQKINERIVRIQTALDGGKNPHYYDEYDKRRAESDLKAAQEWLEKMVIKGDKETNLEANRIEAVETFLTAWREKAEAYYRNEYQQLKAFIYKYEDESGGKYNRERYSEHKREMAAKFSALTIGLTQYGREWETRLNRLLDLEKDSKRTMLIERVTKVTGEIKDAKALSIGDNGEINGFVIGEKGKASVWTISAGGYNIQCFHFCVLVKAVA